MKSWAFLLQSGCHYRIIYSLTDFCEVIQKIRGTTLHSKGFLNHLTQKFH
uniref:Uncharacterized protein n=1 Tax=Rhizophora mucronata TaxID=61149 RepID=A0A2P2QAH0_RHIMU